MQLIEKLEKFGLSRKEAKIYVVLLELGPSPVQEIAKKASINRSTVYVLLGSLSEHGLVGISEKDGVKVYNPAPPERLIQFLEESVKKYTELVGLAHGLVPELKAMYVGVGPKPKVQFFEGLEGIKTAYEDTLTAQETIRAYASIENMHKVLPDYFPEYYQRRSQKNIKIRAIFPDTPEARERITHNTEEAREAMLVPKEKYAFTQEINLYDNKVVFMSLLEKFALIIESAELAEAFKKVFEMSWAEASRLNKQRPKSSG